MNNKVELKRVNGEVLNAELISFFELVNTGKKYIFFTLNEITDNDLVKMYASEIGNETLTDEMTDEEWNNLKNVMKNILTGKNDPNVKYLKWEA